MTDLAAQLEEKFRTGKARLGTIGLGYVGLPLAVEFASAGLDVTGFDLSEEKVAAVNRGQSYIKDVPPERVKGLVSAGRLRASTDFGPLAECDAIIICVPTPLSKTKDPDLSMVVDAAKSIAEHLRPGQLVVLESTTYPGTTEELILPLLTERGLTVGESFFLAFSPERVDPGNPRFNTHNTPKIIGGITPACTRVAQTLYARAIETVLPVSSTQTAEMVKLLENTFRSVNIGLVNEVALMCAPARGRRLGGHRGRRQQALRLHALLSGPRAGRPLHPHRPPVPVLEAQDPQLPGAVHRAGGGDQLRHAGVRLRAGGGGPERPREEREGQPHPRGGDRLQARHRRREGVAGPGHPEDPREARGPRRLQ